MLAWFTQTTLGRLLATFFISMVPVVELRLGLPYGIALGLPYVAALAAAVLGNLLPTPFIIVFVRQIFAWLRRKSKRLDAWITRLLSHCRPNHRETAAKTRPSRLAFHIVRTRCIP